MEIIDIEELSKDSEKYKKIIESLDWSGWLKGTMALKFDSEKEAYDLINKIELNDGQINGRIIKKYKKSSEALSKMIGIPVQRAEKSIETWLVFRKDDFEIHIKPHIDQ